MSTSSTSSSSSSGFTPPCPSSSPWTDPRVQFTFDLVNWDALSSIACKLNQVDSAHWGDQVSGGFNLVRFLHLHDSNNTVVVARIPLRSEDDQNPQDYSVISKRIESEVATMEYVESHTTIPVPHVYHYSAAPEKNVGSPHILMSKVDGVPLSSVWNDMDDERRRNVLRQVIDILLELWSHRFDKPGVLFKRSDSGQGRDAWYVENDLVIRGKGAGYLGGEKIIPKTSYRHAAHYWLAYANANLRGFCDVNFGDDLKHYLYGDMWFVRSLIPHLYDPSFDDHGFPLEPGDFHSQNIMVVDSDTDPRISAIIDWEYSGPTFATTFAQYPFFIVDHPLWPRKHPLRARNVQDQATFDELIVEAERRRPVPLGPKLSYLISNCYGVYLFEQIVQSPHIDSPLYAVLFQHVFGDNSNLPRYYFPGLKGVGILKKDCLQFEKETEVWLEARKVLGDDDVGKNLTKMQFLEIVSQHIDKFDHDGLVYGWHLYMTQSNT